MRKVLLLILFPLILAMLPFIVGLVIYRGRAYKRQSGLQSTMVDHEAPLELHYTPMSLCSSKALLCMHESKLDFRSVEVDIGHFGRFDQLTKEFLKMNPNACVPVLVDRGHPVLESHDIIEYVCNDLGASHLKPKDGDNEAQDTMEYWTRQGSFIDMEGENADLLGPAVAILSAPLFGVDERYMRLGTLLKALPKHPQPKIVLLKIANWFLGPNLPPKELVAKSFQALENGMAAMDKQLEDGRPWLSGDCYTLADITWTANFARLDLLGVLNHFIEPHTHVQAYWQRIKDRPSYGRIFSDTLDTTEEMRFLNKVAEANQDQCRQKGVKIAYGV